MTHRAFDGKLDKDCPWLTCHKIKNMTTTVWHGHHVRVYHATLHPRLSCHQTICNLPWLQNSPKGSFPWNIQNYGKHAIPIETAQLKRVTDIKQVSEPRATSTRHHLPTLWEVHTPNRCLTSGQHQQNKYSEKTHQSSRSNWVNPWPLNIQHKEHLLLHWQG